MIVNPMLHNIATGSGRSHMAQNYLPRVEIFFYFTCHIGFIVYGVYNIYQSRSEILRRNNDDLIVPGWMGERQDIGDSEWENLKTFGKGSAWWLIGHIVLTRCIRFINRPEYLPLAFAGTGLSYLIITSGILPTLSLVLSLVPFYFLARSWGNMGVLFMTICSLAFANICKTEWIYFWLYDHWGDFNLFQSLIIFGWGILKCVSFTLDSLEEDQGKNRETYSFFHFLGYIFYLPTIYLGPPIIYSRFRTSYQRMGSERFSQMIMTFLKDLLRTLICFLIMEFSHHHLFLTSLQYYPDILNKFPIIGLFGYGYILGQQFHMKYVVSYGFACAFAKLDEVDTPPLPICIARVHKYSDMWKYFDRGLYEFLFKYIYCRFQNRTSSNGRKFMAMCMTFCFIYVWHGYFLNIFAWTVLNAIGIILEMIVKELQQLPSIERRITSFFSRNNLLRFEAFCGTQLLILSVIANFFFLANFPVGKLFFERTYLNGILSYFRISITLVFVYFTSEYCQRKVKRRK